MLRAWHGRGSVLFGFILSALAVIACWAGIPPEPPGAAAPRQENTEPAGRLTCQSGERPRSIDGFETKTPPNAGSRDPLLTGSAIVDFPPTAPSDDDSTGAPERQGVPSQVNTATSCSSNADCDDGVFCNGPETCNLSTHTCAPGCRPCSQWETCNEAARNCQLATAEIVIDTLDDELHLCGGSPTSIADAFRLANKYGGPLTIRFGVSGEVIVQHSLYLNADNITLTGDNSVRIVTFDIACRLYQYVDLALHGDNNVLGDMTVSNNGSCGRGLFVRGNNALITNVLFPGGHVELSGNGHKVLGCRFYADPPLPEASRLGIHGSNIEVAGCQFFGSGSLSSSGLNIDTSSGTPIDHTTVHSSEFSRSVHPIVVQLGTGFTEIWDNRFTGNFESITALGTGSCVDDDSTVHIHDNVFEGCRGGCAFPGVDEGEQDTQVICRPTMGERTCGSGPVLIGPGNVFTGANIGVLVRGNGCSIFGNTFSDNDRAVFTNDYRGRCSIGPNNTFGANKYAIALNGYYYYQDAVFGNRIGVDASGNPTPNETGILVSGPGHVIGLDSDGNARPNRIAHNHGDGVRLEINKESDDEDAIATIRYNSITDNGGQGIAKSGYPYPPTFEVDRTEGTVKGLAAVPDDSLVDIYVDPEDEGESYLGTAVVQDCAFDWSGDIPDGNVTATATDTVINATSAFAPWLRLELIDLNDSLIAPRFVQGDGTITRDANILARGGREVTGFAADGVTPILLRFVSSLPNPPHLKISVTDERTPPSFDPQNVGTLCLATGPDKTCSNPLLDVGFQEIQGVGFVALAVLTSPLDFARDELDDDLLRRPLTVSATLLDDSAPDCPIYSDEVDLMRPPVILIHGIWGASTSWTWDILHDDRFSLWAYDYFSTNADSFDLNELRVRLAAEAWTNIVRQDTHIAVTQVDIIAHSMGGVISRLYAQNGHGDYIRSYNFGNGYFHKIITANTPYFGSKLAPLLVSADNRATRFGRAFARFKNYCVDCGGVRDLRPDSQPLCSLQPVQVPAHAMYSGDPDPHVVAGFNSLGIFFSGAHATLGTIFGEDHDCIVEVSSQLGGLAPPFVTHFTGEWHNAATKRSDYNLTAISLLNAPVRALAPGLPAHPCSELDLTSAVQVAGEPADLLEGAVAITSPSQGTVVAPGGHLDIVVESVPPFTAESVLVVGEGVAVAVDGPPFVIPLDVPTAGGGAFLLTAYGRSASGEFGVSTELMLSVQNDAQLTTLEISPDAVLLTSYSPRQEVRVLGHYDDGRVVDLSGASGLVFTLDDPAVATISSAGEVTGLHPGDTRLRTTLNDLQAEARVVVFSVPFDANGDGRVDAADLGTMVGCLSGPRNPSGNPGDGQAPSLTCRDFFDADRDADVDVRDFAELQNGFTGTPPP